MKKFIALLLVLVMGLSLCACGSNNEQMDTDVTAPDSPLYETLQEKMGIDFMKQDVESIYTTEESAAVYLYNCKYIKGNHTFKLGDGTTLQLPMTYGELCDAGWALEYGNVSDPYPAGQINWYCLINSDGKTIDVEIVNRTGDFVDARDAQLSQISLGEDCTESFSLNGIKNGATVKEILKKFGTPYGCDYYEWEDGSKSFSFYYTDEANMIHLTFNMDPDTNRLIGIDYYKS